MNQKTGKPKSGSAKRHAGRFPSGSKGANRLDTKPRFYVGGQIFTRLLYLDTDRRNILPGTTTKPLPGTISATGTARTHEDNVFKRSKLGKPDSAEDYTYSAVELTIHERRGRRYKKASAPATLSDETGTFRIDNPALKPDRWYRLHAVAKFNDRVRSERIVVKFKVTKQQLAKAIKYKTVELGLRIHNQLRRGKGWKTLETEKVKVNLSRPDSSPVLWFGGSEALVFDTFALDLGYMNQIQEGEALEIDKYKSKNGIGYELELEYGGKKWKLPIMKYLMCAVTCTTMILRYFLARKVQVKDVMLAAGKEYLEDNKGKPDYGLDPARDDNLKENKNALMLTVDEGSVPYSREKSLVVVAKKMLHNIIAETAGYPSFGTWRTYSPLGGSWRTTRAMIGAGWPLIAVDKGQRYMAHAVVITGVVVDRKGKPKLLYVNDPFNTKKTWSPRLAFRAQVIMVSSLKQEEVTGGRPERLLSGGKAPPDVRANYPPQRKKKGSIWERTAKG